MSGGTVISLTPRGLLMSNRLCAHSNLIAMHRPNPFGSLVQARFTAGERLVFVTAMGIAVRTLAPILRSKYSDPPVLVVDEAGRYVIPLLSAHEGGGNQWGQSIAQILNAALIVTTASESVDAFYAAGLGCIRGCPRTAVEELLTACLIEAGINAKRLDVLATVNIKHDEAAFNELAQSWQKDLRCYQPEALNTFEAKLSSKSTVVYEHTGCFGVAESAALLAATELANNPAELVISKRKNKYATCAIARAYPAAHCIEITNNE